MMANFFEYFYWVYVLRSLKDGKNYTGYSKNLPSRFEATKNRKVQSTNHCNPLGFENISIGFLNEIDFQ